MYTHLKLWLTIDSPENILVYLVRTMDEDDPRLAQPWGNYLDKTRPSSLVRDRAPGPFYDVGPNPREWVESCCCLSKWRFD